MQNWYVHLVYCTQQRQCLKWQELVIEPKIPWKELLSWEVARMSFLIKATSDMFPSLVRWNKTNNSKCRCDAYASMCHILKNCPSGLVKRCTWHHNQLLEVIMKVLKGEVNDINQRKLRKKPVLNKVVFHPEG